MTVLLPGFLDAHVHVALFDPAPLARGGIARVLDLGGWRPAAADADPDLRFAGQFLCAPGGYPSGQPWAPAGSACPVAGPEAAAEAVHRQSASGASVIKVTLNALAGPVVSGGTLLAIVAAAHERMLPVIAHTEGAGQAAAAFAGGVDLLAHTPFSERLPGDLLAAMAGRVGWISTLDIHGWGERTEAFHDASDNLARFHALGGRVLYGTDLGNGALPVGLNRREIEALLDCGLSPDEVLAALTADFPAYPSSAASAPPAPPAPGGTWPGRVTVIQGERPIDPHDLAGFTDWLLTARALTRPELEDLTP